jgi:hypothetical protein
MTNEIRIQSQDVVVNLAFMRNRWEDFMPDLAKQQQLADG